MNNVSCSSRPLVDVMGIPEFYLNALPDYRRDTLEFLLSLYEYVRQKEGLVRQPQSGLPPKCHPRLSPDIGDAVRFFVYAFLQKLENEGEINSLVVILQNEQSTEIPSVRDHVLRLANENLLTQHASLFDDINMEFRDFLLHFVTLYADAKNIQQSNQDKLKNSIVSPAMIHLRKLVEFYGLHLNQKDPESYIKFYGCVSALLLKLDSLKLGDFQFQVLGEVENVVHRNRDTFPGYIMLDNYAKLKKLFLAGKVQQLNE